MWPLMLAQIFGPRAVPKKFEGFPKEMALRPLRIMHGAESLMIPDALNFSDEYPKLKILGVPLAATGEGGLAGWDGP